MFHISLQVQVFALIQKDPPIQSLVIFTAAGVVPCRDRKKSSAHYHTADYISGPLGLLEVIEKQ